MAQFIGLTVSVTLKNPPDTTIRGLVTDVVEQRLSLNQVVSLKSGSRIASLIIEGPNIEDLEIEPENTIHAISTPQASFVDPAILSYQRPIPRNALTSLEDEGSIPFSDPLSQTASTSLPLDTNPKDDVVHLPADRVDSASATLTKPFSDLAINGDLSVDQSVDRHIERSPKDEISPDLEEARPVQNRRSRRNRKGNSHRSMPGRRSKTAVVLSHAEGQDPITLAPDQGRNRLKKPKGSRQMPLTEATLQPHRRLRSVKEVDPFHRKPLRSNKRTQHHRLKISEDQTGWATGEASDIQDLGDFDFQGNLSKFDKRGVFDKIRQDDTTADEERLVSFNRLPGRSGAVGGRNTENILDPPYADARWDSNESERSISEAKFSSGRSSRKNLLRRPDSWKGGSILASDQVPIISTILPDSTPRAHHEHVKSPTSIPSRPMSRYKAKHRSKPFLRISPSNHICPCLTPLQMAELEQLAVSELGLTDDVLTENAARGVAELVCKIAVSQSEENEMTRNSSSPLVVILAGNNKTGARAVAAGRHLRNHAVRVLVCILGLDREEDLIDNIRRQLSIYRKCGGVATRVDGLSKTLQKLQAPTELIIDALLGMHVSFDDLRTDDQAGYFELANWANHSNAKTLAIDMPSGLDATNDESDIAIDADFIISLGAPKAGLLNALSTNTDYAKWKLFVADIGISDTAWKKFGTKRRHGIEFGNEWVAVLNYEAGTDQS